MTGIVAAETISAIYLVIAFISLFSSKEKTRSTKYLMVCLIQNFIWLGVDVHAYSINGMNYPTALLYIINILAYTLGSFTLVSYMMYCYEYIREHTYVSLWLFRVPAIIICVCIAAIVFYFIIGKIVIFENGTAVVVGTIPIAIYAIQILVLAYLPIVAIAKRKAIGTKAVFVLGLYGIGPILAVLFNLLTGQDYTVVLSAMAMTLCVTILQHDISSKRIRMMNEELVQSNERYQEIAEEKESQYEEITALNIELLEKQKNLETRLEIINSMTSIYFAAYYIDLTDDTFITLSTQDHIRKMIHQDGKAQASLYKACETLMLPEFRDEMREFLTLSTIPERMKNTNIETHKYIGLTSGWARAYLIIGDRDENGKPLHLFYAAREINEEQKIEQEYTRQLEDIEKIVSSAELGMWKIFLKDGEKPRMIANKKMRELLGIENREMSEEEVYDYWYQRIIPREIPTVKSNMKTIDDGSFVETTYLWKHPTLGEIYVRGGGNAVTLEDGTIERSGYHADVTQIVLEEEHQKEALALAMKKAESANVAKSTFLFNMSHDIRTPLNAILGYTELIRKAKEDPEKCDDYVEKIRLSGDFLLALINNVLEMARIESGNVTLDEEPRSTKRLWDELSAIYSEPMKAKGIDFSCTVNASIEYLYADWVKIKEIYLNLLSNAFKYTPEGGKIQMDFTELPNPKPGYTTIQTTVSDTGIGMSEEYLPKLYEEFVRSQNSTESGIQGTGLGMPIVKRYVELMGGTISVQSKLGEGTTFVVTIEHRIADADEIQRSEPTEVDASQFLGKRILLAEDNELNAEIAIEVLKDANFEIEWAKDGYLCVEKLLKSEIGYYDLILMDIQMPNMDGYTATRTIRKMKEQEKASIPIVAMTANAFEEDRQNAYNAGMDGYISKPIQIPNLMETIANTLSKN